MLLAVAAEEPPLLEEREDEVTAASAAWIEGVRLVPEAVASVATPDEGALARLVPLQESDVAIAWERECCAGASAGNAEEVTLEGTADTGRA